MVRRQDVPIFMVNIVVVIHSGLVGKETVLDKYGKEARCPNIYDKYGSCDSLQAHWKGKLLGQL